MFNNWTHKNALGVAYDIRSADPFVGPYRQSAALTNFAAGTFFDYNVYSRPKSTYNGTSSGEDFGYPNTPYTTHLSYLSWTDWTNKVWFPGVKFDQHSSTNEPLFNTVTFQPLTNDTVLIGQGTNLTSWGITNDFYGNTRPATGPWTIGAFQEAGAPDTNVYCILTVNGGTGSGTYVSNAVASISTNSIIFSHWTGSVSNAALASTYVTVTNTMAVTANYTNAPAPPASPGGMTITGTFCFK
jgi:hypothetical protein